MTGRVVVLGDVVDDLIVVPRAAVRVDTDTVADIRPRPGGSAANTAAWLGSLGVPTDFVGAVGAADVESHRAAFARHGVEAHLAAVPDLPTGTIVVIIEGEHRTMLTERGANAALDAAQLDDELLAEASVLHLSGYTLLDGPEVAGIRRLIDRAHANGVKVSFNPGSAGFIADIGVDAFARGSEGADILFANVDEGRLLTGELDPVRVAAALGRRHRTVLVSLGADGAVLVDDRGTPVRVPATPTRVVDPTGAGDAMAAGFLARLLTTDDAVDAARAAMSVAARALRELGGRPPVG